MLNTNVVVLPNSLIDCGTGLKVVVHLQKSIFEGIAQEVLLQCVVSLQTAAQSIERNKVLCFIIV